MDNTLGSATPHPGEQVYSSQHLNAKVRVALDNLILNMKLHLNTILKMGNKHSSFTEILKRSDGSTLRTSQTYTPEVLCSAIPRRRNDIIGRSKKLDTFLDNYQTISIEDCLRQIEAITLTGGGMYRKELIEREKRGVMMYSSLLMVRDESNSTPALLNITNKYLAAVEKSITKTREALVKLYSDIQDYNTSKWFPISITSTSYTDLENELIGIFGITSVAFSECKDSLDTLTKLYTNRVSYPGINNALYTFMNHVKDYPSRYPLNAAKTCLREMYALLTGGTRDDIEQILDGVRSEEEFLQISNDANLIKCVRGITEMYKKRDNPPYKTHISNVEQVKKTLRNQLYNFKLEYNKEQHVVRKSGGDVSGVTIDAKGSHSRKIFGEVVNDNTANSLFEGVLTAKLSHMLYYEFPDESKDKATARSGNTPKATKKATQENSVWTPYDKHTGELPDVIDYIQKVMPLFRPASSYKGYKVSNSEHEFEDILVRETHETEYAFPQTGNGTNASLYGYDFGNPGNSYWVNPYTDDMRYLNTVFWHIRYKVELISSLEHYKRTQLDNRVPSRIERIGDPVVQAMDHGMVSRYYDGLKSLNYITPERFMELEGGVFESVCAELKITPNDKIKLQGVIANFKDSHEKKKAVKDKRREKNDGKRADDKMNHTGESNLGQTLSNFFFPQQITAGDTTGATTTGATATGATTTGATTTGATTAGATTTGATTTGDTAGATTAEADPSNGYVTNPFTDSGTDIVAIKGVRKLYNEGRRNSYPTEMKHNHHESPVTRDVLRTLISGREDAHLDESLQFLKDTRYEHDIIELKRKIVELEEKSQTAKYLELETQVQREGEANDLEDLQKHIERVERKNSDTEYQQRVNDHKLNIQKLDKQRGVVRSLRESISRQRKRGSRVHGTEDDPVIHYEAPRARRNAPRTRRKAPRTGRKAPRTGRKVPRSLRRGKSHGNNTRVVNK